MGVKTETGFTIIETMLFLAISGLLILMIIGGTSASLNASRYRDSVETFKSMLQEQYAALTNIQNARDNSWSCNSAAQSVQSGSGTDIGQSECLLLGKYLRIAGKDVRIYNVLGLQQPGTPANDIASFKSGHALNVSTTETNTRSLEWGSEIAWANAGGVDQVIPRTPRNLSILFLRSPLSGKIYTFTSNTVPADPNVITHTTLANMIAAGNTIPGQAARVVCVESGNPLVATNMAVRIGAYAAGPTAIEVLTNQNSEGIRC